MIYLAGLDNRILSESTVACLSIVARFYAEIAHVVLALPALTAGHTWIDCDIFTDFKIGNSGTFFNDLTKVLMTHDDVIVVHLPRRYMQCVEVAAANARGTNLDQDLVIPLDLRNGDFFDFQNAISFEDGRFHFFHDESFLLLFIVLD